MATTSGWCPVTTTPDTTIKPNVAKALESLTTTFDDWELVTVPDGQGGLWVESPRVALGPPYTQATTYLVFLLPFGLPGVDIYPMFVRHDLTRIDGQPLGPAFQQTSLAWPGEAGPRPVVQVSRLTQGNLAAQTAAQKITKVLGWMKTL